MPRYRLIAISPHTYVIKHGRSIVGSVRPADGSQDWVARLGQRVAQSYSAELAFREVAAQALGFASASALRAHNANVRRQNNVRRAATRATIRGFMDDVGIRPRPVAAPGPVDDEPYSG